MNQEKLLETLGEMKTFTTQINEIVLGLVNRPEDEKKLIKETAQVSGQLKKLLSTLDETLKETVFFFETPTLLNVDEKTNDIGGKALVFTYAIGEHPVDQHSNLVCEKVNVLFRSDGRRSVIGRVYAYYTDTKTHKIKLTRRELDLVENETRLLLDNKEEKNYE